jgi:DNA primase
MFVSPESINKNIQILDLAEEFSLKLETANSQSFDYLCKCPYHKGGSERTGSLYINSDGNNFYCFGCNAGYSAISFYMLCADVDYSTAYNELAARVLSMDGYEEVQTEKRQTNFSIQLDISKFFRLAIKSRKFDLKKIDQMMKKTDEYLDNIDQYDLEQTQKLFENIKKNIGKAK